MLGKCFSKIKVILAVILATILFSSPCFAADGSGGITLTADKTDLGAGDEIIVTADFPDEAKIYALTATLQYDQNVFEPIDDANFDLSDTSSILYNSSNQKFGIINQTGEVQDSLFSVRLRAKNDANVGDTNIALTNISSSDGSNATNYDLVSTKVSVTRDAAEGEVVPTNQENVITETVSEPQSVFYSTPFIIAAIIVVAIVALFLVYHQSKINPNTSKLHYILAALGVTIIALVIGIVAINNGKKDVDGNGTVDYDDAEAIIGYLIDIQNEGKDDSSNDNSATNQSDTTISTTSSSSSSSASQTLAVDTSNSASNNSASNNSSSNSSNPSDPPSSNPPSYDPPSIDDPSPSDPPSIDDPSPSDPPKNPSDYDTDNDGDVDIDDAGHNAEEAQKNTKIELRKLDDTEKYYVEKGNETVQFMAKISPETVTLKKVKIGDHSYDVESSDTNSELYTIKVDPMFEPGQHSYQITEVQASNGKIETVNLTLNYEALKSRPEVADFRTDLENRQISFKINDLDQALQKGEVRLYDINDIDNALTTQSFDSNTDSVTLPSDALAAERSTFLVEILADYCLVEDRTNQNHCYHNDRLLSHQFTMDDHYDFALTDFSLSDYVEPNSHPIMNFNSSNSKDLPVSRVRITIDNQEIELSATLASDGTFEVTLPSQTASGQRHQVALKEVILSDGMVFVNPDDFSVDELSYFVPKTLPKVTNFSLQDVKDNTNIKATFNLEDLHSTISELSVILTDVNENIIAKNTLSREQISGQTTLTTNLDYSAARDKTFTAKILADYDLGDKYNFTQVNLAESDIALPTTGQMYIDQDYITPVAGIVSDSTAKITKYAEKGQKSFGIAFKFVKDPEYKIYGCKNVEYTGVSSYTVNGNNYSAFGLGNGLKGKGYTTGLVFGVPNQAGVVDLSVNRVQFVINQYYNQCSDWFAIPKVTTQFEVLRDIPEIANLKITNEDYEHQTVTFDFDIIVDPAATEGDESFISGVVKLGDQEITIDHRGHNSITFENVPLDENQELDFKASFDRDTDALNNGGPDENQFENYSIYQTEYGLFNPATYQNVKIENAEAHTNYKDDNDSLFEKNEPISVYFNLIGLPENSSAPVSVIVDNHGNSTYDLLQVVDQNGAPVANRYAIFANSYPEAGARTLTISSIILDNGKVININNSPSIGFEILKDVPTISNLAYQKDGAELKIASELEDPDNAIIGTPQVSVVDEDNESMYDGVYSSNLIANYNGNTHYTIKITGDYSRASTRTSASDPYTQSNVTLFDRVISLADNKVELKNITDVSLYHTVNGKSELVDEISKDDLNRDVKNYFVEITMNDLSTLRIAVVKAENSSANRLTLVLDSENLVLGSSEDKPPLGLDNNLRLDFGESSDNDKYLNKYHRDTSATDKAAFEALLEQLNAGNEVTLDQDYDASGVELPGNGFYVKNFAGKFNGAGHTIKNLKGALFETLTGEVSDLYLENVVVEQNGKGTVAHTADGAKVSQIIVHGATLKNGSDQSGGLIGTVDHNTIIDRCAVTGLTLNPGYVQQVGGIAGVIRNDSSISNSYAEGQISGPSGYLGGIVGSSNVGTSTVDHNYAKVTLNNANPACGIGCVYKGKINFTNNVSLSTNITQPISNDATLSDQFENNYYLVPSGKTFPEREGQTALSSASEINRSLFEKLGFSSDVWRLNNSVSSDSLPKFLFDETSQTTLEKQDGYSEARINSYNNLEKLNPFYELSEIVKTGNKVTDANLSNKAIQSLLPVDASGNLVSYLTTSDPARITQLKIVFNDGSHETYAVQYDKTYDMVATYRIPELHLDYTFPHYVIDANSRIVDNLTYYLKGLNYTSNLDNLTAASEGRILRDFYNNTTSNELKEFVLKYLSSTNYTPTSNSNAINDHLERTVKQDHKIEKALYTYNYFRRLYNVDIDGLKLYDYILFGMENQNANLSTENLVNALFADSTAANSSTFSTASTNNTYMNILAKHTGQTNLPAFLESVVKNFGHGQTMADWVHSQFKGFLAERAIDSRADYNSDTGTVKNSNTEPDNGTYYTLWDHFSHPHQSNDGAYKVYNLILPILTLPENSSYIISTPVQFIIGNQRTYIQYRSAPGAQEAFNFRVKAYANRMQTYFKTAYGLLQDTNQFNNIHIFQLDKTLAYDSEDNGFQISQRVGSTADPHFQNFNEVTGLYPADAGNNAASWGPYTEFQAAGVMDATIKEVYDYQVALGNTNVSWNESTFGTWSHETAHSIDSSIWMRGYGRRWRSGGEDYADGNLRQEFNANLLVMNAVKDWGKDCGYASNCSPERIDTQEEIKDFYNKAFDVIYTIDYLQAQAFLELDDFSKSQIGTQISYPNEAEYINSTNPNEKAAAYGTTKYSWLTEEQWHNLPLNDINDLYNNKIMVYPGYYKEASRGAGSYGGEGINVAHWYQPHNYFGMPDSYSLKWLAYEMMSVGGYDNGYIKYNSNIGSTSLPYIDKDGKEQKVNGYKTDEVINQITNYSDFDTYKKDRFAKIEQKLTHLNDVINVKEYVQELYDAMVLDAREQKDNVQAKFNSKDGGETACLADYWCMHGWRQGQEGYSWYGVLDYVSQPHTTAVRHKIYQALKNITHDFVDDNVIYNDSYHQDVTNLRKSITHKTADEIKKDHEFSDKDIDDSSDRELPEKGDDIETENP